MNYKTCLRFLTALLLLGQVAGCGKKAGAPQTSEVPVSENALPKVCIQEANRKICASYGEITATEFSDQAHLSFEPGLQKSSIKNVKVSSVCEWRGVRTMSEQESLPDLKGLRVQDFLPARVFLREEFAAPPTCKIHFGYLADSTASYGLNVNLPKLQHTKPSPLNLLYSGQKLEPYAHVYSENVHKLTLDNSLRGNVRWKMICSEFETKFTDEAIDLINGTISEQMNQARAEVVSFKSIPQPNLNEPCIQVAYDSRHSVHVSDPFYLTSLAPRLGIRSRPVNRVPSHGFPAVLSEIEITNFSDMTVSVQLPSLAKAKLSATYHPTHAPVKDEGPIYSAVSGQSEIFYSRSKGNIYYFANETLITLYPRESSTVQILSKLQFSPSHKAAELLSFPVDEVVCPGANILRWKLDDFKPVLRVTDKPYVGQDTYRYRLHPQEYAIRDFVSQNLCGDR